MWLQISLSLIRYKYPILQPSWRNGKSRLLFITMIVPSRLGTDSEYWARQRRAISCCVVPGQSRVTYRSMVVNHRNPAQLAKENWQEGPLESTHYGRLTDRIWFGLIVISWKQGLRLGREEISCPYARQTLYDVCQGTYGAMLYPLYNLDNLGNYYLYWWIFLLPD